MNKIYVENETRRRRRFGDQSQPMCTRDCCDVNCCVTYGATESQSAAVAAFVAKVCICNISLLRSNQAMFMC